jgi:Na+/H+ antiporter NhaD/arsenite permease-like protein
MLRVLFRPVVQIIVYELLSGILSHWHLRQFVHDVYNLIQVIELTMHMDPRVQIDGINDQARVEIVRIDEDANGSKYQTAVHTLLFGPPDEKERATFKDKIVVDWDDSGNHHVINVYSELGNPLSFTLAAQKQTPLSKHSVLIAALIMVAVYVFILIEVIHRTLVSIFGSMVALFFFFLIHNGETESIKTVMLHQEWSTLGLLFGMMVIVGELSHTGIFEWLAVRILVQSGGSFKRLMVLLCLLTAIASAFLDNVTTMLLLAPVTIDMCGILGVDPRPYLISEVILSNIGGTATQIGDPPNIIIGASFDEVGFLDFIINIMPCIFIVGIPVSLVLVLWIYKPYLTYKEMPELDTDKLKETYPVYDEPRLLIAGTSTFFLIVLFFLHPLHHKDTAWLALISAFLTICFTNPHDVQDVLRNHVEWDTLLFFAGLFVLVEVCAAMGLLEAIGGELASIIKAQGESQQLPIAITLILWVSAFTSAFLDNIPYTATMIPVVKILADELPSTLPIKTLAWALSFGACLGGNGTLLGASANIVTAGIATNRGYQISFMNFFYPGMIAMIITTAVANLYMLVVFVWIG